MDLLNFKDFEKYSLKEFKTIVSKRIKKTALQYLLSVKEKQKKGSFLKYEKLEMQNYFKSSSEINNFEAKSIFNLRSNNLDVASNFSKKYVKNNCIINEQCSGLDSQEHYFECPFASDNSLMNQSNQVKYEDIYGNSVMKQALVMRITMRVYKQRNGKMSSFDRRNDPAEP